MKQCGCGRSYDEEGWSRLEFVGVMDYGVEVLELRNCACHSTLSMPKGVSPKIEDTLKKAWEHACCEQWRAEATGTGWTEAARAWAVLAEISQVMGNTYDEHVFLGLARMAAETEDET
jgi:hypothetical protein